MKFCEDCENYLDLTERRENGNFKLYYECIDCNKLYECNTHRIYSKVYKNDNINKYTERISKFYSNDSTMPRRETTCTKCKETNNNVYFVEYKNNSFHIISICMSCCNNFKLDV